SFISKKQEEVTDLKQKLDGQLTELANVRNLLNKAEDNFTKARDEAKRQSDKEADKEKALSRERDLSRELQTNLDLATRRREIAEGQVARLTQLTTSLQKDISDLRQSYADTRKSLKEKDLVLAMLEERGVNVVSIVAGP